MGRKLLVATLSKCCSLICTNPKQTPKTASCSTFHSKKTLLRRPLSSAVFSYVQTPNKLSKRLHAADSIGEKGLGATCLTCCVFICTNPNQTAVLLGKTFRYSPRGKKKYSSISFNCARGQPDGPANRTEVWTWFACSLYICQDRGNTLRVLCH